MKIYTAICLCLSIVNLIKYGASTSLPNKNGTFNFSGDLSLRENDNKKGEKLQIENENKDNAIKQILTESENIRKSNESVKDAVDKATNAIKKKYNINELPSSGLDEEEEEEAKEDSTFLSDALEEAAHNFASSDQNDNSKEKDIEDVNIKKYQAEVINAMDSNNVYKNLSSDDFEHLEKALEDSDEICEEDYSLPCPLNFFRTSSGCVPLESYKGPCNKVQDKLAYLSDNQKESWSEICEANWPCMPVTCPHGVDYESICPVNWVDTGKGICRSIYQNDKCKNDINFLNKTIDEKKQLEKICGIRWKCKSVNYKTDFTSVCPLNWIQIDTYKCRAPSDYKGPCPKISNFKKYNTEEGKKNVEVACLVNWPYTTEVNEHRDYYASCPIGWSLLSNGSCQAPENYEENAKCSNVVSFANMTVQQKESYSTACNVDFHFKDRSGCRRDYSFQCPLGWIPSTKEGFCKAPIEYKSKICKPFANFKNVSTIQINYYLKFCNIDWPCESEIRNSMIYTKTRVGYSAEEKKKRISGPVESETGLVK